jgi:hypothetical protein
MFEGKVGSSLNSAAHPTFLWQGVHENCERAYGFISKCNDKPPCTLIVLIVDE